MTPEEAVTRLSLRELKEIYAGLKQGRVSRIVKDRIDLLEDCLNHVQGIFRRRMDSLEHDD